MTLDVRLFKILVFVGVEGVLGVLYLLEQRVSGRILFYPIVHYAHFLFMCSIPILLVLPEDNWIWIVEDNPRIRKISLRSKAIKHLHLSMIYIFAFAFPFFIFCLALMIKERPYNYPLTWFFVSAAVCYGIYWAWKNNRNVRRYESLFAVAWDRRSVFLEIFVGMKVSKDPFFFYSGLSLIFGCLLFIANLLGPSFYLRYVGPWNNEYDQEKLIVMTSLFHFFLVTGTWAATMYTVFQVFFSRSLERWANEGEKRGKKY